MKQVVFSLLTRVYCSQAYSEMHDEAVVGMK